MEEKSLEEGVARVKFASTYQGSITALLNAGDEDFRQRFHALSRQLATSLWELEECGATPVCFDGKVAGNAAVLFGDKKWVLLSKSGKLGGKKMDELKDVCIVTDFDTEKWEAKYYAESKDTVPTSDAPLHYAALKQAYTKFGWDKCPQAAVHGHALETAEEAERFSLPISHEETLFSTPPDSEALVNLMGKYPYPKHDVYIRKGHGFVAVGGSIEQAMAAFREKIKPHIKPNKKEEEKVSEGGKPGGAKAKEDKVEQPKVKKSADKAEENQAKKRGLKSEESVEEIQAKRSKKNEGNVDKK